MEIQLGGGGREYIGSKFGTDFSNSGRPARGNPKIFIN
jgi:hypothetical protein